MSSLGKRVSRQARPEHGGCSPRLGGPGSNPSTHFFVCHMTPLEGSHPLLCRGLACSPQRCAQHPLTPLWSKNAGKVYFLDGNPSLAVPSLSWVWGPSLPSGSGQHLPRMVPLPRVAGPLGARSRCPAAPEPPARPGLHPLALRSCSC